MSETSWQRVGRALLGRWPSQVANWGKEGIAAYVEELQADGLTAEDALRGLRMYRPEDGKDFPPSVPTVSSLARSDPSRPTFPEAVTLIRTAQRAANRPLRGDFDNEAAMIRARHDMVLERAAELHPQIASFMASYKPGELEDLIADIEHETYGAVRRRDLEREWERHCEATDDREVAAVAAGRRGGLGSLDPLSALGLRAPVAEIGSGE